MTVDRCAVNVYEPGENPGGKLYEPCGAKATWWLEQRGRDIPMCDRHARESGLRDDDDVSCAEEGHVAHAVTSC